MTFDAKAFAVKTARDTFRTPEADIAQAIAIVERELAYEAQELARKARHDELYVQWVRRTFKDWGV